VKCSIDMPNFKLSAYLVVELQRRNSRVSMKVNADHASPQLRRVLLELMSPHATKEFLNTAIKLMRAKKGISIRLKS